MIIMMMTMNMIMIKSIVITI